MKIQLLHRTEIDDIQWNTRVEKSGGDLPYALTDYLDIVTDKRWSALIGENYDAIFPLPWEIKLGVKRYLQPPFTQQLGLIAKSYSVDILEEFLSAIPNVNTLINLKGNENSDLSSSTKFRVISRSNLILSLDRKYDVIHSNFSKSLRKRIRRSKEHYFVELSKDVDFLVSMYQEQMNAKVNLKSTEYIIARKLFHYLIETNRGAIYLAKNDEHIEGALFVVKYRNRIINLFGSSNEEGKKNFAMHGILNHIIEQNADSSLLFDFEGSDLPGVKQFYESFGPELVNYPEYYYEHLPIWFNVLQSIKSLIS